MHTTAPGFTDSSGLYIGVYLIHDSGVQAVDAAVAAYLDALGAHEAAGRAQAVAERTVERLPDAARADAYEAGASGKPVDGKKRRRRAAEAEEALEDARYERLGAESALYAARTAYLAAVSLHTPALVSAARSAVDSAMLSLTTAHDIARRAAATLDASTVVLTATPLIAQGDRSPKAARPPRRPNDDIDEGGSPGVIASMAEAPLASAISWAQRHLDHAVTLEKERKRESVTVAEPVDDDEGTPAGVTNE